MRVLDDLLSSLDDRAEVRDVRVGMLHTAVVTRECGLAASLPRDVLAHDGPLVPGAGSLLERTARELAEMARSERLLEAVVGVATVNSLLRVDPAACVERNAAELILERGEGRRVAIVGHFPFVPLVRERARTLWVVEKHPREGDHAEADAATLLPQADVVAITGTALTNHTLEHLLSLCDPAAFVVLLGDSVPLSPVLFEHRVDALGGTRVVDPEAVLGCVSQGAGYRQIRGVRRLTMTKP